MMKTYKLKTYYKKILADTLSPVSIYLKIRDKFPNSMLLESSDYHGNDNSFSYICCNPIASLKIEGNLLTKTMPAKQKAIKAYGILLNMKVNLIKQYFSWRMKVKPIC